MGPGASRRGVAPVVSSMLLIVIVVAAFGLTYGAYYSWVGFQRSGSLLQMQERILVEDVWFRSSTLASIYVCNIGKVKVAITSVEVNEAPCTISPTSLSIAPNYSGWINVTYSNGFVSLTTYTFKVITERGTILEARATR